MFGCQKAFWVLLPYPAFSRACTYLGTANPRAVSYRLYGIIDKWAFNPKHYLFDTALGGPYCTEPVHHHQLVAAAGLQCPASCWARRLSNMNFSHLRASSCIYMQWCLQPRLISTGLGYGGGARPPYAPWSAENSTQLLHGITTWRYDTYDAAVDGPIGHSFLKIRFCFLQRRSLVCLNDFWSTG